MQKTIINKLGKIRFLKGILVASSLLPSLLFAEITTNSIATGADVITKPGITDIYFDDNVYGEGDIVNASFTINNNSGTDYTDIYVTPAIFRVNNGTYSTDTYNISPAQGPFFVARNSNRVITVKYKLPVSGVNDDGNYLGLTVTNGLGNIGSNIGFISAPIQISGLEAPLAIDGAHLEVGKTKYKIQDNPTVTATSSVVFKATITGSNADITLTPKVSIYDSAKHSVPVSEKSLSAVNVQAKKTNTLSIPLELSAKPGMYYAEIHLIDQNGVDHSQIPVWWNISGPQIVLSSVSLDKLQVSSGDKFNVSVFYTGASVNVVTGKTENDLGDGSISVTVYNQNKEVVAEGSVATSFSVGGIKTIPLTALTGSSKLSVEVVALKGTNELAKTSAVFYDPNLNETEVATSTSTGGESSVPYTYILIGIVGLIILFIIYLLMRNSGDKNNYIRGLVVLIVSAGVIVSVFGGNADNASAYLGTLATPPCPAGQEWYGRPFGRGAGFCGPLMYDINTTFAKANFKSGENMSPTIKFTASTFSCPSNQVVTHVTYFLDGAFWGGEDTYYDGGGGIDCSGGNAWRYDKYPVPVPIHTPKSSLILPVNNGTKPVGHKLDVYIYVNTAFFGSFVGAQPLLFATNNKVSPTLKFSESFTIMPKTADPTCSGVVSGNNIIWTASTDPKSSISNYAWSKDTVTASNTTTNTFTSSAVGGGKKNMFLKVTDFNIASPSWISCTPVDTGITGNASCSVAPSNPLKQQKLIWTANVTGPVTVDSGGNPVQPGTKYQWWGTPPLTTTRYLWPIANINTLTFQNGYSKDGIKVMSFRVQDVAGKWSEFLNCPDLTVGSCASTPSTFCKNSTTSTVRNSTCGEADTTCTYGCDTTSGACNPPPIICDPATHHLCGPTCTLNGTSCPPPTVTCDTAPTIAYFQPQSSIVNKGDTCTLRTKVTGATRCVITGNNVNSDTTNPNSLEISGIDSTATYTGTAVTGAINQSLHAKLTCSCEPTTGAPIESSKSTNCTINPSTIEH